MKRDLLFLAGGVALFGVTVASLAPRSVAIQASGNSYMAQLRQSIENLEARLHATPGPSRPKSIQPEYVRALPASARTLARQEEGLQKVEVLPEINQDFAVLAGDEGPSWLGVEAREVTSEKAKELKLPAERGVVVGSVNADSPAAKAGVKEKDVITEVNGQRVEGAAQFRRMIREIPAGRTAQLSVWRDGHTQTISVTLGKAEEAHRMWMRRAPGAGAFSFHMPDITIPEMPAMDFHDGVMTFPGAHPRLGIDAEDLSGQLGAYFGAPEGEGVLVRGVNPGSPAEKAGLKAGDVITSFNGERVRSVGDLREKLAGKKDEKTAKLGILRNKSEMSFTVELPPAPERKVRARTVSRRTRI
jgi:predicted metalloprotease with PDZ domain